MGTATTTVTRAELARLSERCAGVVIRQGEQDVCWKPATTVVFDSEFGGVWPACTWHAHRYGGALTLAQIREAIETGATRVEYEVADW